MIINPMSDQINDQVNKKMYAYGFGTKISVTMRFVPEAPIL